MALTKEDKQQITETIRAALESGCLCGLDTDGLNELPHLMGMVRDQGDGNYAKGIEQMRLSLQVLYRMRKVGERLGFAIVLLIVTALTSGVLAAVWKGIKLMAKQSP